jgi:hypothetical protein
MLATLLLYASVSSALLDDNGSIHQVEMPAVMEERKMADGSTKSVAVKYTISFFDGEAGGSTNPDEIREFRSLYIRAESPWEKFSMNSVWESSDYDQAEFANAFNNLKKYSGTQQIGLDLTIALQKAQNMGLKKSSSKKVIIDPNLGVQSGGWTTRKYGHVKVDATCLYNVWEEYDDGQTKVSGSVAGGSFKVGSFWEPLENPYYDRFSPDGMADHDLQSSMGGATFEPLSAGLNVQLGLPEVGAKPPTKTSMGTYIKGIQDRQWPTLKETFEANGYDVSDLPGLCGEYVAEGTDMNQLFFPNFGQTFKPEVNFPAGTVWVPTDSAYQSMTTGVDFGLSLAFSDVFASVVGGKSQAKGMRVICMNMEKKEPAKGVKYFPYRPSDPVIPMLAKRMNASNFRGPWDQARLWIYTDRATIDQVNKKLVGGVSSAGYLMALADVGWAGGLDEKMLKDAKFVKPEFLLAAGAPEFASNFLMNTLDELHPKKAGEWLKKNATSLLQLVGIDSQEAHHEHLAKTLKRLTLFNSPEDREATLKFIWGAQQDLIEMKGKLGSGRVSLYSGRNEEVSVALALVQAGYLTPANDALAYVAEKGPGDANKALAKQLMAD